MRAPDTPAGGMLLRVLVCLGAAGGYEREQLDERFGPTGPVAASELVRRGLAAISVEGRYVRTASGHAAAPSRRALAGLDVTTEAAPAPAGRAGLPVCRARGPAGRILAIVAGHSAEAPLRLTALTKALAYEPEKSCNVSRVCENLARNGRLAMEKRIAPETGRQVWYVWAAARRQGGAA